MDKKLRRIIGLQVGVTILAALTLLLFLDANAALSAFLGGAICFVTSFVYAIKISSVTTRSAQEVWRAHSVGEFTKWGLTVALFAGVFAFYENVAALPLLITYAVVAVLSSRLALLLT